MSEAFYTDKDRIRASFERAATSYDAAAVLQREVSDRMAERLSYIKHQPQVILDAGTGTGYGAAQLRAQYPDAQVWSWIWPTPCCVPRASASAPVMAC
jgi:malonyl-CoA O-methyltransferase